MEFLSKITNTSISALPEEFLFFGGLFGFLFVVGAIIVIFYQLFAQVQREKNIDIDECLNSRERVKTLMVKLFLQGIDKRNPSFRERLDLLIGNANPEIWIDVLNLSKISIERPISVESQDYRGLVENDIRLYYALKVFLYGFDRVLCPEDIRDISRANDDAKELNEASKISRDCDLIQDKYLWLKSVLSRIFAITNQSPRIDQALIYSQPFLLAQYLDFAKIRPMTPPSIEIGLIGINQVLKDKEVSGVDIFDANPLLPEEWMDFIDSVISAATQFKADSVNLSIELARFSMSDITILDDRSRKVVFYTSENKDGLMNLFNSLNINYQVNRLNGEFIFETSLSDASANQIMQSIDLTNLDDVSMSSSAKEDGEWFEVTKKQLVSDILRINEESLKKAIEKQEALKKKESTKTPEEMLVPVDFWVAFRSDDKSKQNNRTVFNQALEYFEDYVSFTKKDVKKEKDSYLSIYIYRFTFPNREIELSFVKYLFESIKKMEGLQPDITLADIPQDSFLRECFYHVREYVEDYLELDMQSMINPFTERISSTGIYQDIFSYLEHLSLFPKQPEGNILPKIINPGSNNTRDYRNVLILRSAHNNFSKVNTYEDLKSAEYIDGIQLGDIPMFYEIANLYNAAITVSFDEKYIYTLFEPSGKTFSLAVIEAKIAQIYSQDAWEVIENLDMCRCRLNSKDITTFSEQPNALESKIIYKSFNNARRKIT